MKRLIFLLLFSYFSIQSWNRVLKVELETYKIRVKVLQEENRSLRQASVIIVSEFIYSSHSPISSKLQLINSFFLPK